MFGLRKIDCFTFFTAENNVYEEKEGLLYAYQLHQA